MVSLSSFASGAAVALLIGSIAFGVAHQGGPLAPQDYQAPPPRTPAFETWGLGISVSLTERPPYVDDPNRLEWLAGRINTLAGELAAQCGGEAEGPPWTGSDLRGALGSLALVCTSEAIAEAAKVLQQGSEEDAKANVARLHAASVTAFHRAVAALSNATFGDEVEAQALASLMADIQTYRRFIERYDGDARQALNLAWAAVALENLGHAARAMDWSGVRCSVDVDWAYREAIARLERAKALAVAFGNETDQDDMNSNYGGLYLATEPNLRLYRQHGWGPALLSAIAAMDLRVAYWEGFIAGALPTRDEGQALLHEYYRTHRHLRTEEQLSTLEFSLENPYDAVRWNPSNALEAKVLGRMGYYFDRIQCP